MGSILKIATVSGLLSQLRLLKVIRMSSNENKLTCIKTLQNRYLQDRADDARFLVWGPLWRDLGYNVTTITG